MRWSPLVVRSCDRAPRKEKDRVNRSIVRAGLLIALIAASRPASATSLELLLKCANPDGRPDRAMFVPVPERVAGVEYTPRVTLLPGSEAWKMAARPEFSETDPPAPRKPALYLLDGEVIENPDLYTERSSEIKGIFVSCSDMAAAAMGIEPGRDMVVAFTYPVLDMLREEMRVIESRQMDFLRENNRFAASLEELGWAGAGYWEIALTLSEDGSAWEAVGRHVLLDERYAIAVIGAR